MGFPSENFKVDFKVDPILSALPTLAPKLKSLTLMDVRFDADFSLSSAIRPTKIQYLYLPFPRIFLSEDIGPVIHERQVVHSIVWTVFL